MSDFAELAHAYEPKNIKLLNALLKAARDNIQASESDHANTLLYASVAYSIADLVAKMSGVDIRTLEFAVIEPPYPEDHPLIKALNVLDPVIKELLQRLARAEKKQIGVEDMARLQTAAVWKGYLMTLSIPPQDWGSEDYDALESLHILSTFSGSEILSMLKTAQHAPYRADKIEDWPPPGFLRIWSGNRERINANTRWGEFDKSVKADEFSGLRESYNPNNIRQLNSLLELTEKRLQQFQEHEGFLKLYVATAFEIAIEIHRETGVNICRLSFPMKDPPLPETHPMMVSLAKLDALIASNFDTLAGEGKIRVEQFESLCKMEMALVWKGHVLTLNTPPENWFPYNYAALGSLRILSTVTGTDAIEVIEERGDVPVRGVDTKDWPPPGFLKVYFSNRDRLASKPGWTFG